MPRFNAKFDQLGVMTVLELLLAGFFRTVVDALVWDAVRLPSFQCLPSTRKALFPDQGVMIRVEFTITGKAGKPCNEPGFLVLPELPVVVMRAMGILGPRRTPWRSVHITIRFTDIG